MIAIAKNSEPLPLPDVWLPLNNNLKMITGFGSNSVQMGADSLTDLDGEYAAFFRDSEATVVDKSGTLVTVPKHQPRFDSQGLVLEGASTNLYGDPFVAPVWKSSGGTVTPVTVNGFKLHKCVSTNSLDDNAIVFSICAGVQAGYIQSFYIDPSQTSSDVNWSCYLDGTKGYRVFWPARPEENIFTYTYYPSGIVKISGKIFDISPTKRMHIRSQPKIGATIVVGGVQVDALPFSTSLVQHTGFTRADEVLTIPARNNMFPITTGNEFTLSCQIQVEHSLNTPPYRDIFSVGNDIGWCVLRTMYNKIYFYRDGEGINTAKQYSPGEVLNIVVVVDSTNNTALYVNGEIISRNQIPYLPGIPTTLSFYGFYGHLRNLRIWHHALTKAQINTLQG